MSQDVEMGINMTRTRKIAAVILAAIAGTTVAFTLARSLGDDGGPKTIETASGFVLVSGAADYGSDAAFDSRLEFTANGCLGIAGPNERAASQVVVFPAGTTVTQEDPLTIEVNGSEVSIGEAFSGSGGEVKPTESDLVPTAPPECLEQSVFLMSPE